MSVKYIIINYNSIDDNIFSKYVNSFFIDNKQYVTLVICSFRLESCRLSQCIGSLYVNCIFYCRTERFRVLNFVPVPYN